MIKMITEDYCNFDIAKLLKEKGFNEKCKALYTVWFDEVEGPKEDETENWNIEPKYFSAPTLQMTIKWLREVHHYYIQIMLDSWACGGHMGYYVVIQKTDSDFEMMLQDKVDKVFYETPEEAAEDAIKYILEDLI